MAVLIVLASAANGLHAEVISASPTDYRERLRVLKPGDRLQLDPGDYYAGLPLHRIEGEPARPILITGPDAPQRAVLHARPGAHTISIVDAAHVEIRNLELDGHGLAVDGVRAEGHGRYAHHITLTNLHIHGHGNNQQSVGISTKCPAWGWVIRDNVILGAGTGMYLGNSDGSAPFIDGVIEYNFIADTLGYNLQIKHQKDRPGLPGMPATPRQTVIRHNVFSKAQGSSTGPLARPNVLVGHWPLADTGTDDRYLIYGNFFYRNPVEALFQGEGNIALYNNVFVNPDGDAVHIQPHNDIPRWVRIFNNTVVARGNGIRILLRQPADNPNQEVADNLVFAAAPISGVRPSPNRVDAYQRAGTFLTAPFSSPGQLDVAPRQPLSRQASALTDEMRGLPEAGLDFNRNPRPPQGTGALGWAAPATPLVLSRKTRDKL